MQLTLALLPLAVVFGLIATKRVSIANAGLLGAAVALAIAAADVGLAATAEALARGLWVAWFAISIILTGLFFQRTALAASPDVFAVGGTGEDDGRRRAFAAVFLLGVFVESASGFGLGAVAAAAVLRASGLASGRAAGLALLSLALVPWGALAIGAGVAAGLAELPITAIGVASAELSIPVVLAALALFWTWAPGPMRPAVLLEETLWIAGLLGLLWLANVVGVVDVAGVIAAGALFALRWAIDRSRGRTPLSAGPFAGFAVLIVALRLAPGVTPALEAVASPQPWGDLPPFPLVAHASFWLIVAAVAYGAWKGLSGGRIAKEAGAALRAGWIPTAVTAGYVVLGEGMSATGAPQTIANAIASAIGDGAPYTGPVFAALAGWLTGSNAAAHGMLIDLQAAIGQAAGGDRLAAVATQNVVASAFTMLSPMRVALVAAALGLVGAESRIVARLAPFALAVLIVGWAATAFW